jgi:hypothetical protein
MLAVHNSTVSFLQIDINRYEFESGITYFSSALVQLVTIIVGATAGSTTIAVITNPAKMAHSRDFGRGGCFVSAKMA